MVARSHRYPANWKEIATTIKNNAGWRCRDCGMQCIKPGDDTLDLTLSQRMAKTLNVHHSNYLPEDNRPENLIPLCSGCHLTYHNRRQSHVTPGQLSLSLFNI